MLREHEITAPAEVGRRVFIKGLAATGALVGGLAVGVPASAQEARGVPAKGRGGWPSPFASGWTSQPGKFLDDVPLPDGFTYDVVASYRDPTADTFEWAEVAVGGQDAAEVAGFSSPDNLVFDRLGDLWMVTDISSSASTSRPARTPGTATTASS